MRFVPLNCSMESATTFDEVNDLCVGQWSHRPPHYFHTCLLPQACLDLVHSWVDEEPYMRPAVEIFNGNYPSSEDQRELTDEQLVSCDLVKGLLRMGILQRIR